MLTILLSITMVAAAVGVDRSAGKRTANAWMYIADPPSVTGGASYSDIPSEWDTIDYSVVDTLIVGPVGIQHDGSFGFIGNEGAYGSLQTRFEHVLRTARAGNPSIEIEVSIWWQTSGCTQTEWGRSLCALADAGGEVAFAAKVVSFLQRYDLGGFDIDYESTNVGDFHPSLAREVGAALSADGLRFSISPASTRYLDEDSLAPVDAVYMQSYAGGTSIQPSFFAEKMDPAKVFIGLCPETNCGGALSPSRAMEIVEDAFLGGSHLWRLNSDNWEFENAQQAEMHALINEQ